MRPHALLGRCMQTPGGHILRRLIAYYPNAVFRGDLMLGAGLLPRQMGEVAAYAAFYRHLDRVNLELAEFGWEVVGGRETHDFYHLREIAAARTAA